MANKIIQIAATGEERLFALTEEGEVYRLNSANHRDWVLIPPIPDETEDA